MNIILATQNRGKVEEFNRIFLDYPVRLSTVFDYGITHEPEETGVTFSENAQIKLEYYLKIIQKNKFYDKISMKYPTAALAIISFDEKKLSNIKIGTGKIIDFIKPRDL